MANGKWQIMVVMATGVSRHHLRQTKHWPCVFWFLVWVITWIIKEWSNSLKRSSSQDFIKTGNWCTYKKRKKFAVQAKWNDFTILSPITVQNWSSGVWIRGRTRQGRTLSTKAIQGLVHAAGGGEGGGGTTWRHLFRAYQVIYLAPSFPSFPLPPPFFDPILYFNAFLLQSSPLCLRASHCVTRPGPDGLVCEMADALPSPRPLSAMAVVRLPDFPGISEFPLGIRRFFFSKKNWIHHMAA